MKIHNAGIGKEVFDSSDNISADEHCRYFASVQSCKAVPRFDHLLAESLNSFKFNAIDADMIAKAVKSIKSNAAGVDEISLKFMKLIISWIIDHLVHIFNFIIECSMWPEAWKISLVCPVPKIRGAMAVSEYRPIGLLPILSKTLEVIMNLQIQEYIELNGLDDKNQSEFKKHCSTTTALLKVCDDIRTTLDNGKTVVMILIDFSKAFDSIDHNILCAKLKTQFKFSTNSCNLMHSYLENRKIQVKSKDSLSDPLSIYSGIVQGSILGPGIFPCYIKDLVSVLKFLKIHIFADDVGLYCEFDNSDVNAFEITNKINLDLEAISIWSKENKIYINEKKTEAILIARNPNNINKPMLKVNSFVIPFVEKIRYLGVIMDSKMKLDDHISHVCSKVYYALRTLTSVNDCLPLDLKIKLIKSLVIPIFTYADVVFSSMNSSSKHRLDMAFNACLRFIYNRKKFDHISDVKKSILGCDLFEYYDFRLAIQIFKIINTKQPSYLFNLLEFSQSRRTLNLKYPRPKSNFLANSFTVRAAQTWNNLPNWIKLAANLNEFKTLLASHFNIANEN